MKETDKFCLQDLKLNMFSTNEISTKMVKKFDALSIIENLKYPRNMTSLGMISVGMIRITQMDYMASTVFIMDQQSR